MNAKQMVMEVNRLGSLIADLRRENEALRSDLEALRKQAMPAAEQDPAA